MLLLTRLPTKRNRKNTADVLFLFILEESSQGPVATVAPSVCSSCLLDAAAAEWRMKQLSVDRYRWGWAQRLA